MYLCRFTLLLLYAALWQINRGEWYWSQQFVPVHCGVVWVLQNGVNAVIVEFTAVRLPMDGGDNGCVPASLSHSAAHQQPNSGCHETDGGIYTHWPAMKLSPIASNCFESEYCIIILKSLVLR